MGKTIEDLLIINIIMFGVSAVGTGLALLWFRMMRNPIEKGTAIFIAKIFLAIWAATNVIYFMVK